jgi:hypothetical protein
VVLVGEDVLTFESDALMVVLSDAFETPGVGNTVAFTSVVGPTVVIVVEVSVPLITAVAVPLQPPLLTFVGVESGVALAFPGDKPPLVEDVAVSVVAVSLLGVAVATIGEVEESVVMVLLPLVVTRLGIVDTVDTVVEELDGVVVTAKSPPIGRTSACGCLNDRENHAPTDEKSSTRSRKLAIMSTPNGATQSSPIALARSAAVPSGDVICPTQIARSAAANTSKRKSAAKPGHA